MMPKYQISVSVPVGKEAMSVHNICITVGIYFVVAGIAWVRGDSGSRHLDSIHFFSFRNTLKILGKGV